ncbi:unnamed protein product [Owenia fusiformis]|uniref:Uncharacterized protein n=1 Tax=Owenia fusiformis TaxID=6347 RepID=A0A8J1XZL1_OWEFU|nr:unnamed protein product [Owenia fusiformis]
MLVIFVALILQAGDYTQAQEDNTLYWCECALFREDGFLNEIEPNLQNLTGGYVNLGERLLCNNGDLNVCDRYCRRQIISEINGNYTFYTLIQDGTNHTGETYGDHMCERVGAYDKTELPIDSPGYAVFAFSRMQDCVTLDTTWYTFPDSQFDPPNNLCCNADGTYTGCF